MRWDIPAGFRRNPPGLQELVLQKYQHSTKQPVTIQSPKSRVLSPSFCWGEGCAQPVIWLVSLARIGLRLKCNKVAPNGILTWLVHGVPRNPYPLPGIWPSRSAGPGLTFLEMAKMLEDAPMRNSKNVRPWGAEKSLPPPWN